MNLPLQIGAVIRGPRRFLTVRDAERSVRPSGCSDQQVRCDNTNSGCQGDHYVCCDKYTEKCDPNGCQCLSKKRR